jgi:hypothetical protein
MEHQGRDHRSAWTGERSVVAVRLSLERSTLRPTETYLECDI